MTILPFPGYNEDLVYTPPCDLPDIGTLCLEEGLAIRICDGDRIDFLAKYFTGECFEPRGEEIQP